MDFWSEIAAFAEWLLQGVSSWSEAVATWLLQVLQGSWPFVVDSFNIVMNNPEPVAIGLATGVFIIMLGLVGGRAAINHIDRKSSRRDENLIGSDDDGALEDDVESESSHSLFGSDSQFRAR